MAITISRLTREFIFWPVDTGISQIDLSAATAEAAFMEDPSDRPASGDWNTAELVQVDSPTGMKWHVRCLVGPGHQDATDLSPSGSGFIDYQAWVRITDAPEQPVRKSGLITVE